MIRPSGDETDQRVVSWVMSIVLVVLCSTVSCLLVPQLWHWLIVPLSVAGVLVAVDAVDWARGRMDVLQPRAMVALLGLHLCYVGPILNIAWDYWPRFVAPAQDWRASIGVLATVYVAGLLLYRFVMGLRLPDARPTTRVLDERRFVVAATATVAVGMLALVIVIFMYGGPLSYLQVLVSERNLLTGSGWILLLAESWPLLLFAVIIVTHRRRLRSHVALTLVLVAGFVVVQFVTGGLRGSRANTVWPTMIAITLVYLLIVRFSRKAIALGLLLLIAFMYVYGLYKSAGQDVAELADRPSSVSTLSAQTGRTLPLLLLEDFGRAGTQALVVDRLSQHGELGWGSTYVGDVVRLVPDSLIAAPTNDKVGVGTELLNGKGSILAGERSSRIYGLVGEAMINFGLVGGVIAFLPFALVIRLADRSWSRAIGSDDVRSKLLACWLPAAALVAIGSDLDNVLWLFIKQALLLVFVVLVAHRART